jgi:hypothetical protein
MRRHKERRRCCGSGREKSNIRGDIYLTSLNYYVNPIYLTYEFLDLKSLKPSEFTFLSNFESGFSWYGAT